MRAVHEPLESQLEGATARRCACGGSIGPTGECAACRAKRIASGAQLAPATRATQGRAAHDFSQVGVQAAGRASPVAAAPTQRAKGPACDRAAIEAARRAAAIRAQSAYQKVAGIGPPSPTGAYDAAYAGQRQARTLARTIFEQAAPDMSFVGEVVGEIRNWLSSPRLAVVCAEPGDRECRARSGYVRGNRPPIVLCRGFFAESAEQRVRTMLHEAAHLSGIGESGRESYCLTFDCQTGCFGTQTADAWAHLVHCLSGPRPDLGDAIVGRPKR